MDERSAHSASAARKVLTDWLFCAVHGMRRARLRREAAAAAETADGKVRKALATATRAHELVGRQIESPDPLLDSLERVCRVLNRHVKSVDRKRDLP